MFSQLSSRLFHVVHLNLNGDREGTDLRLVDWHTSSANFHAKTLRVSRKIAERVALALEDVPGEMVTEVMPSLKGSV